MRPGYVMHRYAHRLFDGTPPTTTYATDGAEMGKALVAEGLGIAMLPDFSISADPLVTAGVITTRPDPGRRHDRLAAHAAPPRRARPRPLRDLQAALARHAGAYRGATGAAEPSLGRTVHVPGPHGLAPPPCL